MTVIEINHHDMSTTLTDWNDMQAHLRNLDLTLKMTSDSC